MSVCTRRSWTALSAFFVAVGCARAPRPPECEPLPPLPREDGLAPVAVRDAVEKVRAARAAMAEVEGAWLPRNHDVVLCRAAHAAVAEAQRRRAAAETLRDQYEPGGKLVDDVIATARAALDATAPWVAAGLVDGETSARLEAERSRIEERRVALSVARTELEAAGWDVPAEDKRVTALVAARTATVNLMTEAEALGAEVAQGAIRRCTGAESPGIEVRQARNFGEWMVLSGVAGDARGALLYAFEPETRTCTLLEKVVASQDDVFPGTDGETLLEWNIPGVIPARILVGWSARGAWFLARDGGWRLFRHSTGARCPITAAGCGAPNVGRDEVTATCTCGRPTDPEGIREGQARYAWDGSTVIREQ